MKMTLQEIHAELNVINENVSQWIAQGYTPTVEKEIVLQKLQHIYQGFSEGKPVASYGNVDQTLLIQNEVFEDEIVVNDQTQHISSELVLPEGDFVAQNEIAKVVGSHVEATLVVMLLGQQISVTQRDAFVNELFWRDELFFANEIRKFQVSIKSLDQALIYIGEKYSWSASNVYAEQFISLLENYYK